MEKAEADNLKNVFDSVNIIMIWRANHDL